MQKFIESLTRARLFALLVAICATGGAWAAAGDSVTFANDGRSFSWTHMDFADSNSYTITIPSGGSLSAGDYVRVNSFAFGRNSVNDAVNVASVTSVDFAGNTISSASYATDNKFPTVAAWKEKYSFGAAGSANDLILKVGETYDFALLNSSGSTPTQHLGVYTTTDGTYSPVAQTVTDASTKRMQQEVVVTVLASVVTSAGGNWSALSWSNAPADWTSATTAPVLVIVEESCSIALDTSVSVDSIIFDIASGKTLTLTGANSITAANGIFIKGGTIAVANEGTLSGAIKVQGDAGITISGNSDSAGTISIDVAEGKTLNLSASALTSADTINLTGSGAVVPQTTIAAKVDIGAGVTVSANSGDTIRVSNFKGVGTIVFDGVLPSSAAAANSTVTASATDSSNWTGTLWLKNYNTDQGSKGLYMPYWGNVDSKVKFTNVAGYLPCKQGNTQYLGYDDSELGEWILEDEVVDAVTKYAFTKTDGYSGYWVRFKKLSGSGTIAEKSGKTQTPKIRIADGHEFTGTLKLDQGMRVAFSDSDVAIDAQQIVIASGEEVTATTAWTTSGFIVNGTLNLNATPSGNIVSGSGTVNLGSLSVANGISGFASAAAWTGKVVVPAFTASSKTTINFNDLGNQDSYVVLKGISNFSNGYYQQVLPSTSTVNTKVKIDGNTILSHSNYSTTTLSFITGDGNLTFDCAAVNKKFHWNISELSGYNGIISAQSWYDGVYYGTNTVSIGTLNLYEEPTVTDRLVKLPSSLDGTNITDVASTDVAIDGEATEYKLVKKNIGTATAGLYLAPAVIKASDGTLTPYESVDDAFTALSSLANDAYDYVAVYESANVTFTGFYKMPKIKTVGEDIVLTINSGYGDYGWIAGSPVDGVVTYSVGPIPADYTWVGAENAYWSLPASWSCGGVAANRAVDAIDNTIFTSDASVTIQANVSVASITNSAAVTFTADSAKTLTVGDGGVVMTTLGNSITLTNVTLSKTPATTAATLAVQTTGGGDDPIVYTVVNAAASVGSVGYATLAGALAVEGENVQITLQQNVTGDVVLRPGQTLILNGKTVSGEIVGNAAGVEVIDFNNLHMYYMCVDNTTNTWKGTNNGVWNISAGWTKEIVPGSATAVTISSFTTAGDPATTGTIALPGDTTVKSITLGEGVNLTLTATSASTLTTTDGAIMLASGQSISVNGNVTLSPAPSTSEEGKYVKITTVDSTTTYTVADHKATVYDSEDAEVKKYDTVAEAVSAATEGQKVTLFADSSEAITLNDKSITFNEGSYTFTGTFTGSGTLIMTALPNAISTSVLWAAGWTGTLWLKSVTFPVIASGADAGKSVVNPVVFGNENSTLRLTSCSGGFSDDWTYEEAEDKFPGTLDLVDEDDTPAFTVTSGWPAFGKTVFAKLTGTGTLTSSNPTKAHYYQFLDASEFRGTINITNNDKFRVGIGSVDANVNNGSSITAKTLTIQSGASATIAAGKTWTAPGGITVDGSLSVANTGTLTGTIAGGGTITYAALPSAPTFGSWTGTVVLPANQAFGGQMLDDYGIAGSKVRLQGANTGWFYYKNSNGQMVATTIEIPSEASLTVTGLSPSFANGFDKLIGEGTFGINITGDIDLSDGGYSAYFQLKDVSGFTGSLSATGAGIAISDIRIANSETGGKIIVAKDATVHAGATWTAANNIKMTGTATLTYDPGDGNTYTMNSHIASATTSNKVIVKSGVLKPNSGAGANGAFSQAEIEIQDGAELLLDYSTDVTGYNDCGAPIRIKSGGILNVGKRETMAHDLYFEGGTLKITGTQGGRGLDLFSSRCDIVVTENSQILATGDCPVYLRDGDVTMNIAEGKTLACNCAIIYHSAADNTDANSKSNLIKQGSGALVLNGYNGGAFALPKGLNITAGVVEVNTVLNSNGQTGDAANVYTVASGAKLKVGSAGQVNTSTLTLNDGSQLEFGVGNATLINASTVTFASGTTSVAFSSGVTPTDDTTLLTWSSAPDGTFTLADDAIAANFRLVKDGSGLKIAAIVKIDNTSSVEVGYIDASGAAVITNTVGTILLSSTTTTANFYPNSTEEFAFNGATGLQNYNVYVKYIDGNKVEQTQNIYGLFTLGIVDAQAGNYKLTLNPNGTAAVNEETIYLKPALRAGNSDPSPMAYTGEGDLKFNVKAIPGLYYAVKAYSSPACADGDLIGSGEAKQAISATVSPEAPAIGAATVQYYKVAVGLAEDEVSPTP